MSDSLAFRRRTTGNAPRRPAAVGFREALARIVGAGFDGARLMTTLLMAAIVSTTTGFLAPPESSPLRMMGRKTNAIIANRPSVAIMIF